MTRSAPLRPLVGWAAGLGLALVALVASGHGALSPPPLGSPGRWQAWFEGREPVAAAFAILRLAAVGGCLYLVAATVVGAALRLVRAEVLVAAADRMTVAPVRRLLAATVTLSLAGIGPAGMVASAQPAPSTTTSSASTTSSTTTSSTTTSTSTPAPLTTGPTPSTSVTASSLPPAPATITMRRLPPPGAVPGGPTGGDDAHATDRWTVEPGDCFWTIAEELLQRSGGRAPSDAEIVPYWLRLIEANRAALADPDNADLIFPGQVFSVPPPPPSAAPG